MMWCQLEQLMVNQHKLRVQPLQLMQVEPIRLQQQLRVRIHIRYLYAHRAKLQIVQPKL